MIQGDINKLIQASVRQLIERTPHSLNQEQIRLVTLVCQEIVKSIAEEIAKTPAETKSEEELFKIKAIWKELNKLLK